MRHRALVAALTLTLLLAMPRRATAAPPDTESESGFALKRDEAGIRIYTREVPGTGRMEFKGVLELPRTRLSSALALLDDVSAHPRFMYECTEAKVLRRVDFFERYTYSVIHSPWPISDRDVVARSIARQDPASGEVVVRVEGRPDFAPRREGRVRVPVMRARWAFTPRAGGGVIVSYRMYMEPGGSLSKGLANMVVEDVPWETLTRFREAVRDAKYADVKYAEIKDPS